MLSEANFLGQLSWVLESDSVCMALTHAGAHLAPVRYFRNRANPVQPYHISPWQGENHGLPGGTPDAIFRGDFFCLPFGKTEPELAMCNHGLTSAARWSFVRADSRNGLHSLEIEMKNALGAATVTRRFFLIDSENVIYDLTSVNGLSGEYTLGHHAVLRTPRREGALLVSTSPQVFGMTFPGPFADTANGERQSLAYGAEFTDLISVPSIVSEGAPVNCSSFPARAGFGDLLQVAVAADPGKPAWTTAVNTEEGYLWFSLRDPVFLPSTILWIEHYSRQSFPWNGRNCSLGLEDVCSYFDMGSAKSSARNEFSQRGIKTVQSFQSQKTFELRYAQGVALIPDRFGRVRHMKCDDNTVSFIDEDELTVIIRVQTRFLFGGALAKS